MSGPGPDRSGLEIRPNPTDEEAAAIAAAVYLAWPRPTVEPDQAEVPTTWRFSGRWWQSPSWRRPARRRRP